MMELHDKQVTVEFTVERTTTTRSRTTFTTTFSNTVIRTYYGNIKALLTRLVEDSLIVDNVWEPTTGPKHSYEITSYKELE